MGKRLSQEERERVIREYGSHEKTMIELAGVLGVSRQGIWKILRVGGIDTTKRRFPVKCHWCEKEFLRTKKRIRKNIRNFCSEVCYMDWVGELGADYIPNRHGQRIARVVVSKHFELKEGHVVHHEDKNTLNNMLSNLKVFVCNGDHISYHRDGSGVVPIWVGDIAGRKVISPAVSFFNPQPKKGGV